MKRRALIVLLLLAVAGCSRPEKKMETETRDSTFQVGQVWHYHTRPQEPESTFTIVKIDAHPKLGTIIHISVSGLKMKNPRIKGGYSGTVGHMPFSEEAIDKSVLKLAKENAALPSFEDGYKEWQQAKGGVFTITVAEAIDAMERAINR